MDILHFLHALVILVYGNKFPVGIDIVLCQYFPVIVRLVVDVADVILPAVFCARTSWRIHSLHTAGFVGSIYHIIEVACVIACGYNLRNFIE